MRLIEAWFWLLPLVAAAGSGLAAGVFLAFSTFVMPALARLQPERGIEAMQSINALAVRSLFMVPFVGAAILSFAIVPLAFVSWDAPGAPPAFLGAMLYLAGSFGVTARYNVQLNHVLANVPAASPLGAQTWQDYLRVWTRWNHVRTIAAAIAAGLFVVAWCENTHVLRQETRAAPATGARPHGG